MKRKIWILAAVICMMICVCALASADGMILKNEAGDVLNDGDSLEGKAYYRIYVSGLPDGCEGIYLGWTEDMNAEQPDGWEDMPRRLGYDEIKQSYFLEIIPDPFDGYDQEIMFARIGEDDQYVRKIQLYYNREEVANVRPRITRTNDPELGQEDFALSWTAVANADCYFIRWELPTGDYLLYSTGETSITLEMQDGRPAIEQAGSYLAEVIPLIGGRFGRGSSIRHYWVNTPEPDGRIWLDADRLDENNNRVRIRLNESVNYHISAPGAEEVRFITGEGIDSAIQLNEDGYTDYFWMPERQDWEGERHYMVYAQAKFGEEWATSNTIDVAVQIDGDISGDIDWSILNEEGPEGEAPTIPRDGLAEIEVEPMEDETVDFYCAYIVEGNHWIADSHWVDANPDGPTTILMPVAGCAPGTYEVHVFAVRFGSRSKESEYTRPITVVASTNETPITISMKNSFETGEPLWIRARYENPQNLQDAWMHVEICPADGDGNPTEDTWYSEDGEFDFWDNGYQIGWRGTYILTATIMQNAEGQEDPQEVAGTESTFTFEVETGKDADNNDLELADPEVSIQDKAYVGGPLNLQFTKTQNAEQYGYWIHREEDNENLMNDGSSQPEKFSIDTNRLEPGIYWVETDVMARGYEQGHTTLHFVLMDRDDTELSGEGYYFSVSAEQNPEDKKFHIGTNDGIRFLYYVPGADQVRILDGNGTGENEDQIEHAGGPGVKGWRSWDEPGEHNIYGSVFNNGSWSEPVLLCTINVLGRLDEPDVDIPWVVDANQNQETVKITFHNTDNAMKYSYCYALEDDDGDPIAGNSRTTPGNMYIDIADLEPNHVYRVFFDVEAPGFMNGHTERTLYVIGDDDENENIWLNINPNDTQGINSVGVGETFDIEAHAENAQDIFIRQESDGDIRGRYESDYIRDTYCVDDSGKMDEDTGKVAFTAFARVNGCELLVRRAAADVTGTDDAAAAAAPTLTIAKTSVARNEFLAANVTSSEEGAYEYHVNIFDSKGEKWFGDYCSEQRGTILIPTGNLPEGEYRVGAWVRVHGKYSGDTGHSENKGIIVSITECKNKFICSSDTVQVCEPITVSICAPGAERIRFSSGYDRWDGDDGWEGDSWYSDDVRWNYHSDTTTIRAEAMFDGRWEPIGSRRITITAEDDLAQPDLSNIPATVTAGEDHTFSFPAIENAEFYDIEVRRNSDGNWRYTGVDAADGQETIHFRLNGAGENDFLHKANEGYTILVTASGTGYNANRNETTFVTVPNEADDREIALFADRYEAQSNQDNVHFIVQAEGASIAAIYFEDQWQWAPTDEDGQAEFDLCFNQDILQPVWAKACYNQAYSEWGWEEFENANIDVSTLLFEGMSNIVDISVYSDGETMGPDWVNVPETVSWGKWLAVKIGEGGNAETYHLRIHDENGNEIFFKEVHSSGTCLLPTSDLDPSEGNRYWVSLDVCCTGFTWSHAGDWEFTVNPISEQDDKAFMTADREWAFVDEPYYVQMYAPGAVQLMAAVGADSEEDANAIWKGDHGVSDRNGFRWEEAGLKTLNGYAKYTEDGAWVWIDSVMLEVFDRDLQIPEILTGSVVDNSDDLPIMVTHVRNGGNYHLDIHSMDGRNVYSAVLFANPNKDYVSYDEENNRYLLTFVIPAGTLQGGESYWIDCNVDGVLPGMNGNENSRMILAAGKDPEGTPNIDDNISLFVNKTHAAINEMFTVEVNAPGAKAIRIRIGDQWRAYRGHSVRDQFSEFQPYKEVLYAQACYDDNLILPEDLRDFDWEDPEIHWGCPSQAVEMEFFAEGQANQPWFTAPITIRRGEILTISRIGLDVTANEAHANILWNSPEDDYEDWVFENDWQGWNENTREIHLSTNNLGPGTYWLAVDCSGIGFTGNRRWHQFTVTEEDEYAFVFNAPETVMLGEALPVSICAPDAWRIGFATDGERWDLNEEGDYHWGYDMEQWTDTENVRWDNTEDLGEHTITAYVLYGDTEEEISIERKVTVIDPNLRAPEIRADDVVSNTEALNIIVPMVPNGIFYNLSIHMVNRDDEESYRYEEYLKDRDAKQDPDTGEWLLTFTVPADTLGDGGYWIDCYVDTIMAGFRRSENHKAILVRNNAEHKDSSIEITVDSEQLINQDFPVSVSAEGAKAFIIRCGDQTWGSLADEQGNAEFRINVYQPGAAVLYAQACYNDDPNLPVGFQWNFDWENAGIAWEYPSDAVSMNFISFGPAGKASFDAPIVVARGDVLEVTNIYPGDGANEAHANINRNGPDEPEDQVYEYGWHGWDEKTRTIHIATSMLEAGNYWLMVDNSGTGRENSRAWHEFTVTERGEQAENGIIFTVPEKVQTGCIVPINVYAPGAARVGFGINLREEDKNNPAKYELMMNGEIAYNVTDFLWDNTGTITVTAYAEFDDPNDPVTIDKTLTICDPMIFDLSGLPGYFTEGQENATVTIPLPVNADWMSIQIHADWDGGRETLYQGDYLTGRADFTVPGEWLTEGNRIHIDWSANGAGFQEIFGWTDIMIVAEAGEDALVALADPERDINNIMTNDPVEFRVSATAGHELTGVQFFDGHGYGNYGWTDEDGSICFMCNYNHNDDPGQILSVFAQVQLDGNTEWQTTNCLRFTVKTPHGTTGRYDFTELTPIHASRGQVVTVTFTDVEYPEGKIRYWADVFTGDGRSFNPSTDCDGNSVMISTSNIPAGRYVIRGRAVKDTEPGWRWSESTHDRELIIDEEIPEAPQATFVTPAMLTEIDEEAFVGISAEVIEISENVRSINRRAFADSRGKPVIIRSGDTWIDDSAFEGCGTIVVYGPISSYAQQWAEWHVYEFYPGP